MPVPSSVKVVLDLCKNSGKAPLRINYPAVTVTDPGPTLAKKEVQVAPTLSISSSIVESKTTKYIAISLDIDAPMPSMAVLSPVLHLIQADLTAEEEADAEGWIKLSSSVKPAARWGPPNPPPFSSAHRYVFLVWEQPEGLTNDKIKADLGLPEEVGIWPRARWDEEGCEKKLGLATVLGGNYFIAG